MEATRTTRPNAQPTLRSREDPKRSTPRRPDDEGDDVARPPANDHYTWARLPALMVAAMANISGEAGSGLSLRIPERATDEPPSSS